MKIIIIVISIILIGSCGIFNNSHTPELHILDSNLILEKQIAGIITPFSMLEIPTTNQILITERETKQIAIIENDVLVKKLSIQIENREISSAIANGILGVAVDPDFETNKLLYIAVSLRDLRYPDIDVPTHSILKIKYDHENKLIQETIFEKDIIFEESTRDIGIIKNTEGTGGGGGGKLLFLPDKTLLFSIGFFSENLVSQDMSKYGGKIIRLHTDGRPVCEDTIANIELNPFCSESYDAQNSVPADYIYTLGHKNVQGMTIDPVTQRVYATEHGEKGGDEINVILSGRNYGFPYFCSASCTGYSGQKLGDEFPIDISAQNFTAPVFNWTIKQRSFAPSGLTFSTGENKFKNNLLVATLGNRTLHVVSFDKNSNSTYLGRLLSPYPYYIEKLLNLVPIVHKIPYIRNKFFGQRLRDIFMNDSEKLYVVTDAGFLYKFRFDTVATE